MRIWVLQKKIGFIRVAFESKLCAILEIAHK